MYSYYQYQNVTRESADTTALESFIYEEYILLALTFMNPTPISPFHFEEWNKAQSSFCVVKSLSCVPQKLQKLASFFFVPFREYKVKILKVSSLAKPDRLYFEKKK